MNRMIFFSATHLGYLENGNDTFSTALFWTFLGEFRSAIE